MSKIIIQFAVDIDAKDLSNDLFNVTARGATRKVNSVYLSDTNGVKDEALESGKTVTIALDFVYTWNEARGMGSYDGSPFTYANGYNNWTDPFNIEITLNGKMGNHNGVSLRNEGKLTPAADQFTTGGIAQTTDDGQLSLTYAAYAPKEDDHKNPLIVWLHGSGEGGTDPTIPLYGANVSNLISDEVQDIFGGAYVLIAQTPDRWLDYGNEEETRYSELLMRLIDEYVTSHQDVDPNRIYIGGCSNGGVMTMDMILKYTDYFAAAFPICMGYQSEWITDEQIEALTDLPIFFTHAVNDASATNQYETTSKAVYDRLVEAGAENVHFMSPDDVIDSNGNKLMGHWSWVYALNNTATCSFHEECGDQTIMEWLSLQTKEDGTDPEPQVDKSELEALIKTAEALKESEYTAESWAVLQSALVNAKTVFTAEDATQADVASAISTLEKAIAQLQKVPAGGSSGEESSDTSKSGTTGNAKTGDFAGYLAVVAVLLLSVGAAVIVKQKRNINK